jgi:hypothetical protein
MDCPELQGRHFRRTQLHHYIRWGTATSREHCVATRPGMDQVRRRRSADFKPRAQTQHETNRPSNVEQRQLIGAGPATKKVRKQPVLQLGALHDHGRSVEEPAKAFE